MTHIEATTRSAGNIGYSDRGIRIVFGLAALIATLHLSIDGDNAYPLVQLVSTAIVLTGIVGWDPFYAAYRTITANLRKKDQSNSSRLTTA